MNRKANTSDLNEEEWRVLKTLIPHTKLGGATTDNGHAGSAQRLFNFYAMVVRGGCPMNFPHGRPYTGIGTWRKAGVWEQIHRVLWRKARRLTGRQREPHGCILDSQPVKTTERGGVHG